MCVCVGGCVCVGVVVGVRENVCTEWGKIRRVRGRKIKHRRKLEQSVKLGREYIEIFCPILEIFL